MRAQKGDWERERKQVFHFPLSPGLCWFIWNVGYLLWLQRLQVQRAASWVCLVTVFSFASCRETGGWSAQRGCGAEQRRFDCDDDTDKECWWRCSGPDGGSLRRWKESRWVVKAVLFFHIVLPPPSFLHVVWLPLEKRPPSVSSPSTHLLLLNLTKLIIVWNLKASRFKPFKLFSDATATIVSFFVKSKYLFSDVHWGTVRIQSLR